MLATLEQAFQHPYKFCFLRSMVPMDELQHHHLDVTYHTLYTIIRTTSQCQSTAAQAYKRASSPSRNFKRPVRSDWNAPFRLTVLVRCECPGRMRAASAC
jgi:hypothetical protein